VCAYRSCDSESDRVAALRLQPNRCRALGSQHIEPEKMTQEIKTNSFVISGGEQVGEGAAQRIEARARSAGSDAEQPNLLHVYGRFTLHRRRNIDPSPSLPRQCSQTSLAPISSSLEGIQKVRPTGTVAAAVINQD
jgi:hypothetical protein